jgi:hypothetical protein
MLRPGLPPIADRHHAISSAPGRSASLRSEHLAPKRSPGSRSAYRMQPLRVGHLGNSLGGDALDSTSRLYRSRPPGKAGGPTALPHLSALPAFLGVRGAAAPEGMPQFRRPLLRLGGSLSRVTPEASAAGVILAQRERVALLTVSEPVRPSRGRPRAPEVRAIRHAAQQLRFKGPLGPPPGRSPNRRTLPAPRRFRLRTE